MKFSWSLVALMLLFTISGCKENRIEKMVDQMVGTQVIAHRGYWKQEGSAQNSISSLRNAHRVGVYGSEFDVQITADSILIVNHDNDFKGHIINLTNYKVIKDSLLSNGEKLPTLEDYLAAGKKLKGLQLVLELKPVKDNPELEKYAVEKCVEMVKKIGLEKRVDYISFSLEACKGFAALMPKASVAYLGGYYMPIELLEMGINGFDYHYNEVLANRFWVDEARNYKMTSNVWTVNDSMLVETLLVGNPTFLTTDNPEEVTRQIEALRERVRERLSGKQ
ncbi:MAG TPA: glycerophosphodiester phosphodiesterase family protein [Bacteroidales bacterium]|jgi:glycerophosphoryl diester phosphodiesterase|nr:glycerophosphodiester phosphodiesterase family protein [Bacteroidales bacterium]